MFLTKLLSTIGLFFTGLFNEAKKTWKKLSPELQTAMLTGSNVIKIINDNLTQTPQFVIDMIQKAMPSFDEVKLKNALQVAGTDLGIAESTNTDDLTVLIGNIQKLLAAKTGTDWAKASHTAYLAISVFLAPTGTKVAALVSLAEYVYHDLIKGGN